LKQRKEKRRPRKADPRVAQPIRTRTRRPQESERDGYVPNVVYTCGRCATPAASSSRTGISDSSTAIAVVTIEDLLRRLAV